jgi:hypothetical protein
MDGLTLLGLLAVSAMLVFYAIRWRCADARMRVKG